MSETKTVTVEETDSEQNSGGAGPEVHFTGPVGNFDSTADELVVDERTFERKGHGALKQLVDAETGEVVIAEGKHSFGALNIGGNLFLTSSHGATDELYTLDGEKIRELPTLDFKELKTVRAGGREYYALTRSSFERTCLVDPETGEFLTEFHSELVVDGCTVKGYRSVHRAPEEVVRVEPDIEWARKQRREQERKQRQHAMALLERELANDDPVEAPEVTDDVEAVCADYVEHNDFEWVLALEAELEDAMV